MTNETMKDGERAARYENALIEDIDWCIEEGNCGPRTRRTLQNVRAILATAPTERMIDAASGDWLFWDECGTEVFGPVIKNGRTLLAAFPSGDRWANEAKKLVEAHNAAREDERMRSAWNDARAAAPQAALTDAQKDAIKTSISMLETRSWSGDLYLAAHLKRLLTQAPTERMSDAGTGDVK